MMMVGRRWLFAVAALMWGVPGVIITLKGVKAYGAVPEGALWWHLLITVAVLLGFFFMFRRVVERYSAHILSLSPRASVFKTFSPRGWMLMAIMMCLGMAVRFVPGVPNGFVASFYSGLGPMLLLSSARFLLKI
ncbi:MAG: hypothetical protein J6K24_01920 [Tidjanibacter sp.]|nr:hypothetical protein [Tidjanibacter sp.]